MFRRSRKSRAKSCSFFVVIDQSSEGKAILAFAGIAIANGIRSSIKNESLPDVEILVCGEDSKYKRVFKKVKENGRIIIAFKSTKLLFKHIANK